MRGSLTWDRGIEMTRNAEFSAATGVPVSSATRRAPGSQAATRTPRAAAPVLSEEEQPVAGDAGTTLLAAVAERGHRPRRPLGWRLARGRFARHRCADRLKSQVQGAQFSAGVDTPSASPRSGHADGSDRDLSELFAGSGVLDCLADPLDPRPHRRRQPLVLRRATQRWTRLTRTWGPAVFRCASPAAIGRTSLPQTA